MKKSIFYSFILSLVLAIVGPLNVISSNLDDFQILDSTSFLFQMFSLFTIAFIMTFILFIILYKTSKYSEYIIIFILSVLIIWNLYLPLPMGKLDGIDIMELSMLNMVLGLGMGLTIAFFKKHRYIILPVIIIGPLILSATTIIEKLKFQEHALLELSNQKNILVISLDALQYKYINEVMESNETMKKSFNGFVNYPNVNAVAPFTYLSCITTKLGYLPKTSMNLKDFKDDFITSKLAKANYNVQTYSYFNYAELSSNNQIPQYGIKPIEEDKLYLEALKVSFLKVFPSINNVSKIRNIFINLEKDEIFKLVEKSSHSLAHYNLDILDYNYFVKSLKIGNVAPIFLMHHYVFTHDPITFDSNCNYRASDTINQKKSILGETTCAVKKMLNLINKLKEIGAYDNSLIIFTSDHGYEKGYNDAFDEGAHSISKRWSLSRYTPFLMIKDFNNVSSYSKNNKIVSLLDIPKTICLKEFNKDQCSVYTGIDLLKNNEKDIFTDRQILVSKTDKDKRSYSDFNIQSISREVSLSEYFKVIKTRTYQGSTLPSQTGSKTKNLSRIAKSTDKAGFLTYGPYLSLKKGKYIVKITYSFASLPQHEKTTSFFDIVHTRGTIKLYAKKFINTKGSKQVEKFKLELKDTISQLEVRSFYNKDGVLEIYNIEIEKDNNND